jgi:hypothetical protein
MKINRYVHSFDFEDASVMLKLNRSHPMMSVIKSKMDDDEWNNYENMIVEILNDKYRKSDTGIYSLVGEAFVCSASK